MMLFTKDIRIQANNYLRSKGNNNRLEKHTTYQTWMVCKLHNHPPFSGQCSLCTLHQDTGSSSHRNDNQTQHIDQALSRGGIGGRSLLLLQRWCPVMLQMFLHCIVIMVVYLAISYYMIVLPCTVATHMYTSVTGQGSKNLYKAVP